MCDTEEGGDIMNEEQVHEILIYSRKKDAQDTVLKNLLEAQKNMAAAEKVDAIGLILLSRFLLRLLEKLDDKLVQLAAECQE